MLDLARRSHQGGLKQHSRRQCANQRHGHQPAHARHAGIARHPEAAECRCSRQRAEEDSAGQARLQQIDLPPAPRLDIVDLEGDTDAEQQRQGDDVGEIQAQPQ